MNRLLDLGDHADWIGTKVFVPSTLVVLATGIAMMINGDLDWGQFWIIFGLIAWATSAAIGIGYITPKGKRLTAIMRSVGRPTPRPSCCCETSRWRQEWTSRFCS
jgi:hypothetical protein